MNNNFDFLFRFIIVGDTNVGKTCLLSQFTDRTFKNEHEATIGVEFGSRIIKIKDKKVKIQIWDTAGQETFKSVTRSYYKGAIAAFIVYDIADLISFQNAARWLEEVKCHASEQTVIALIANKADQEDKRKISLEEGETFAKQNGLLYFETSARKGTQVDKAFTITSTEIVEKIENGVIQIQDESRKRGHTLSSKPLPLPTQTPTSASSTVSLKDTQTNQTKSQNTNKQVQQNGKPAKDKFKGSGKSGGGGGCC